MLIFLLYNSDWTRYIWQNCECVFVFLADNWPITSMVCSATALITGSSSSSIRFFDKNDNFKLMGTLCIDEKIGRHVSRFVMMCASFIYTPSALFLFLFSYFVFVVVAGFMEWGVL